MRALPGAMAQLAAFRGSGAFQRAAAAGAVCAGGKMAFLPASGYALWRYLAKAQQPLCKSMHVWLQQAAGSAKVCYWNRYEAGVFLLLQRTNFYALQKGFVVDSHTTHNVSGEIQHISNGQAQEYYRYLNLALLSKNFKRVSVGKSLSLFFCDDLWGVRC
jgi:hypothetical protein